MLYCSILHDVYCITIKRTNAFFRERGFFLGGRKTLSCHASTWCWRLSAKFKSIPYRVYIPLKKKITFNRNGPSVALWVHQIYIAHPKTLVILLFMNWNHYSRNQRNQAVEVTRKKPPKKQIIDNRTAMRFHHEYLRRKQTFQEEQKPDRSIKI